MKQGIDNAIAVKNIFQDFAQSDVQRFSNDLQESILQGRVYYAPHTVYVKKDIAGASGKVDLINTLTKNVVGISNVHEGKLPKRFGFIYDRLRILLGKDDAGKEAEAEMNEDLPKELKTAHLVVGQAGRVHFELPIEQFVVKRDADNALWPNHVAYDFVFPNVIRDDETFFAVLKFPDGVTMAAGDGDGGNENHYIVGLYLEGYATRLK